MTTDTDFTISTVAEQNAKEILDIVYSQIQAKLGIHLSIYESRKRTDKTPSKYIHGQVKRYKHMLNHVSFLRNNRAYWKIVATMLERKYGHGN